ncbi:MAG TPA: MBL fold metallo-hydrolase [Ktedonobacteraceae bacterium]
MNAWPQQHIEEVAEGIVVVLNGAGEMGVSNACCVIEQQRALVVDTMTFPYMADGMIRELERRAASPDVVLNTHHHIDHMGGNKAFGGARIVAHPTSVQILNEIGLPAKLYDTLMPQFRGHFDDLELLLPEPDLEHVTLPRGAELHIFTPAHTPADITVWFPETRVLLAGDLCFVSVTPLAVHGLLSGWIKALDALLALDPLIVVPGHGSIGGKADLIAMRTYLEQVYQLGQQVVAEGLPVPEALAYFNQAPAADWLESERTALNLQRAILEVRGEISSSYCPIIPPQARP